MRPQPTTPAAASLPNAAALHGLAGRVMRVLRYGAMLCGLLACAIAPARAEDDGLVTQPSAHGVDATIRRFEAAVRAAGWAVFGEVDHAAAARAMGLALDRRTVILFGNPRTGTPAMAAHPTLALDLPMRVLVWQDAQGKVFVTRSTGADIAMRIFARHGIALPQPAQASMETFLHGLVERAVD